MAQEIRMPALGQTTDELVILRWFKRVGDTVMRGDPLLEVETDKATLEVEAALSGVLLDIVFEEGAAVQSGETIAYVGASGEKAATGATGAQPSTAVETAPVAEAPAVETVERTAVPAEHSRAFRPQTAPSSDVIRAVPPAGAPIPARPPARYLARLHHVDLAEVKGTGRHGLIEKRDVQAHIDGRLKRAAESLRAPAAEQPMTPREVIDMPVPPHRLRIARQMTESAQTIPQIRLSVTVDMACARSFLQALRLSGLEDLKVTHLLLMALATALTRHPRLNTLWIDDGPQLRRLAAADVGLAVARDDHLLVVSIPEPTRLAPAELVSLTSDAINRAKAGKLSVGDLRPAAVTLSNLGMYGIDDFDALVEPGKTGIVAAGQIKDALVPRHGGIHILPQMKVTLTVDHRVVDGALAAEFLMTMREYLETMDCAGA